MDLFDWIFDAALVVVAVGVLLSLFLPYSVEEHERAVVFVRGRFRAVKAPGVYPRFRPITDVRKVDIRRRFRTIPGQELLTVDGISLKMSLALEYEVTDAYVATVKVENLDTSVHMAAQLAARDVVSPNTFEVAMERRAEFGAELLERVGPALAELGVTAHRLEIKDIMLPGELKRIFAQVAQAKHEGAAALERARAETAALRSLANAAKMLKDNPELVQVRMFDLMSKSTGNTFVLGEGAPKLG